MASFAVVNAIPYVDYLIKDYLLFRGFFDTFKRFDAENAKDKCKGFDVKAVVQSIMKEVHAHEIEELESLWGYLQKRFFSGLDTDQKGILKKLHLSIQRYYLIYAIKNDRKDKTMEFFAKYGEQLCNKPEWKIWFVLPYTKHPEKDTQFAPYFEKEWISQLEKSLHNFLANVFQTMPLPKILNFNVERLRSLNYESEIEYLRNENKELKRRLHEMKSTINGLKMNQIEQSDQLPSTLLKHVTIDNIEKAKQKLIEEEKRVQQFSLRFKDEAVQSSITSVNRRTVEVQSNSPDSSDEAVEERKFRKYEKRPLTWKRNSKRTEPISPKLSILGQELFTGHTASISKCRFSS